MQRFVDLGRGLMRFIPDLVSRGSPATFVELTVFFR